MWLTSCCIRVHCSVRSACAQSAPCQEVDGTLHGWARWRLWSARCLTSRNALCLVSGSARCLTSCSSAALLTVPCCLGLLRRRAAFSDLRRLSLRMTLPALPSGCPASSTSPAGLPSSCAWMIRTPSCSGLTSSSTLPSLYLNVPRPSCLPITGKLLKSTSWRSCLHASL